MDHLCSRADRTFGASETSVRLDGRIGCYKRLDDRDNTLAVLWVTFLSFKMLKIYIWHGYRLNLISKTHELLFFFCKADPSYWSLLAS